MSAAIPASECLAQLPGPAQPARDVRQPQRFPSRGHIRVSASLALINVTVTDRLGRSVANLTRENFRIREDKVEHAITHFSVGIVFDSSSSMQDKISESRIAVARVFSHFGVGDEAFVVEFADRPVLTKDFTVHIESIPGELLLRPARGRTALFDAVVLAANRMKHARNGRKALLVVSDGIDNSSRYTRAEALRIVEESDVQIYTIAAVDRRPADDSAAEIESGADLLGDLAGRTGGFHFLVETAGELHEVAEQISVLMHSQYVLGYRPTRQARDGKFRRVSVKLAPPPGVDRLWARWRPGYYAPAD